MPLPIAQVEHALPGRMRLRIPGRRGDPSFFTALAQRLQEAALLRKVQTNWRTGSVLLLHEGTAEDLVALAKDLQLFAIPPAPPHAPRRARAGHRRKPHPLALAAAGFAVLAAYQAVRGAALGSASETLWHAYTLWRRRRRPQVAVGLAGLGVYQALMGRLLGPATSFLGYALHAHSMALDNGAGGGAMDATADSGGED
jgi:hypothetical protein